MMGAENVAARVAVPELLRQRWVAEAEQVGLHPGSGVDDLVIGRQMEQAAPVSDVELAAALVDPTTGLCATESKFCEAHVVEPQRPFAFPGDAVVVGSVPEGPVRALNVLVDPQDRTRLMLYEIYDDEKAFEAHQQTPHFKKYLAEAIPLLASRERSVWKRL